MRAKQKRTGRPVIIEQVDSEEEPGFIIEQVDSDEEGAKTAEIEAEVRKQEYALMNDIRLFIVQYIKHIGEDRSFFPDDITDVIGAFEQWTLFHSIMTELESNWSRVRKVCVGSSHAQALFKKRYSVLKRYPIYNMTAGLPPYQEQNHDAPFSTADSRMGIAMEEVIRDSHVAFFSKPLKAVKPGQVISTRGLIGASCTGDIELQDSVGQVVSLMEVKTLCKAKVPLGLMIPDTEQKTREVVREILATHGQFHQYTSGKGNIFRQSSRFVDLKLLQMYGLEHATQQRAKYDVHLQVHPYLFLECCKIIQGQRVDIYFYEPGNRSGEPEQEFSMSMETLGLCINPWSSTTMQMLWQQCVYSTSYCRTIKKDQNNCAAWMNLLLVVPYKTEAANPQPYLIMKMPVFFPDDLCEQVQRFYAASTLKYITRKAPQMNLQARRG